MQSWSYGLRESERRHQWLPWSVPHRFTRHRWSCEFFFKYFFSPIIEIKSILYFGCWLVLVYKMAIFLTSDQQGETGGFSWRGKKKNDDECVCWNIKGRDGGTSCQWNKECDNSSGRGQSPESGVHIIDWSSIHGPKQESRSSCGRDLLERSWILQEHQGALDLLFLPFFRPLFLS